MLSKTALFHNCKQWVVLLLLNIFVLVLLLSHFDLVSSLGVNRLLEDTSEDVFLVLDGALLVYCLLGLAAMLDLSQHLLLLTVDLLVAVHFKFVVLLLDLLLF